MPDISEIDYQVDVVIAKKVRYLVEYGLFSDERFFSNLCSSDSKPTGICRIANFAKTQIYYS